MDSIEREKNGAKSAEEPRRVGAGFLYLRREDAPFIGSEESMTLCPGMSLRK